MTNLRQESNKIEETKIDSASLIHFSCTILSYPILSLKTEISLTEQKALYDFI